MGVREATQAAGVKIGEGGSEAKATIVSLGFLFVARLSCPQSDTARRRPLTNRPVVLQSEYGNHVLTTVNLIVPSSETAATDATASTIPFL